MQLAATRKGGRKRCAICSQIYQRRMQAEFIESGALRRVIAVYRAKHRLQPCEPKPRPAEARRYSPRWLRHENNTVPTEAELANLQRTLFLNEANATCRARPATAEARTSAPGDCGSRNTANYKTAERQKTAIEQPSANNYSLSILLRHYAASGLLNLPAALTRPFPQKLRAESSKRA